MRKRTGRMLLALLLALCVLTSDALPFLPATHVLADTQAEIDKRKKESEEIAAQRKKVEAELADIASEKKTALRRKELLDQQIELLTQDIENTEGQITQYEQLIADTQAELADAQQREAEQYDLFCARVRAMEERGTISYWSVLFSATSFSDLLSAFDFIGEVMDSDQSVISDLQTLQQQISEKETSLESTLAELQSAKTKLDEDKTSLQRQRRTAENLIAEILSDEETYQELLGDLDKEKEELQKEIVALSRKLAEEQRQKTTYGGYIWPETVSKRITSPVGSRNTGIKGASTNHMGIDIGSVGYNTKVLAAKAGTVIVSAYNSVRGNYIVISHGSGNTTLYQHLSKRSVSVNQTVKQGDVIGITGSTGVSGGAHLHFEITENGVLIDPLKYLTDYIKAW